MNVLFIAEDTSRFINRNFYYLEQELSRLINLTLWRKSGHIHQILKQVNPKPDFILLLHDMGHKLSPQIKGLGNSDIPTGLFVNDVHRLIGIRRNFLDKNKIPHVFTIVRDPFLETYPEFKHKMEWFPHFINTEVNKDYGLRKDIDLLMMGAVNDVYPLRKKILKYYSGDQRFVYHAHPGYREFTGNEVNQQFIGHRYAMEINRSKVFFTCPSVLHYPVIKYFEALASKTLLLAPSFKELEDLGFIPGYHFVSIDETDFQDKAEYYLENEKEREKIVEQGYQFICAKHSVKVRAEQLVKIMERILYQ